MSLTKTIQDNKSSSQTEIDPRRVRIGKLVLNIGVGKSGEAIERARRVLEDLTHQKASSRKARKSIRDFGVHKGEPIGMMVTLRAASAYDVLKLLLQSRENKIQSSSFDDFGNCSFGIKEHIEIPGVRYNPEIGIFGLNASVVLERSGYRVARRTRAQAKIGKKHRVHRDEATAFFRDNFGVEVL